MAKNLYILECPAISEYNMETKESGRTYNCILLLPIDYYQQLANTLENKDGKKNNPKLFWQTP